MGRLATKLATSKLTLCLALLLAVFGPASAQSQRAFADELTPRSLTPSSNLAGDTDVTYRADFRIATTGPIGSIAILFCANTPLLDQPCDPPVGFDASSVILGSQLGQVGFALYSGSTANTVILTRPPGVANAGTEATYDLNKITNPSSGGPLFARFLTYPSSDASGPATDAGGMALYLTNAVNVNAEVPPYITFCIGENISGFDCSTATEPFSDMGSFSPDLTAAAQHQILVATNAGNGYNVSVAGTSMTSGNNVITAMTGGTSQKGVSQFGINLRANTTPTIGQDTTGPGFAAVTAGYGQQNHFRFNSGDIVATTNFADDYRKYTISYIVNVPPAQPGGVYSTTLTYVCLANF